MDRLVIGFNDVYSFYFIKTFLQERRRQVLLKNREFNWDNFFTKSSYDENAIKERRMLHWKDYELLLRKFINFPM